MEGTGDNLSGHDTGLAKRSRYADNATMVSWLAEALRHPSALAALQHLDSSVGSQVCLHGAYAVPVTGHWYGYSQNDPAKRKIAKSSINMRSHGDALFLSPTYPEELQLDPPRLASRRE